MVLLSLSWLCFSLSAVLKASQTPAQLIPPLSPVRNVTGSLNTFIEQVQEMNPDPPVIIMGNPRASGILQPQPVPVPVIPPQQFVPTAAPIVQPAVLPQQPAPIIDPALQRLLNSFNTLPGPVDYAHPQQVAYSVAPMVPGQPGTVVSYVTCYVGCSHVTNVVSGAAKLRPSASLLLMVTGLLIALTAL